MKLSLSYISLIAYLIFSPAYAQPVGETVTTTVNGDTAQDAKGAGLRTQVNDLSNLVLAKKLPEADRLAADLRKHFESSFAPDMQQFSFHSADEQMEFQRTSAQAFEWIDWGYPQCLQIQAYIASERRDFPAALAILASIEAVAPVSANAPIEIGYILNQLRRPAEALAAYQRAISLSTRYRSQAPFRATALRGMGFALIELKRLDEAESTFQESLKIEPNNKLALNELTYIQGLRSKK